MKTTTTHFFPFLLPSMAALLLSFSLFLPGFSAQLETQRLIEDTMNAYHPNDISDLARLAISEALNYATNTKGYADELARQATDEALRFYLGICSNAYGVVINNFTAAKNQFEVADFAAALESEQKAVQPIKDCDFMFTRPPERSNPLLDRNKQMGKITETAISAMKSFLP